LGLTAGIPVTPAVHDQYAAALGAGATVPGDINFGAGTAWVLLAHTDRLALPIVDSAIVAPHPIPGVWGQMLSLVNGGSAIDWAMGLLGQSRGSLEWVDSHVEQAPPGSDGLRCWPLLVPGTATDSSFRDGGRLDRMTLAHGPCHLLRAVVEGLACELARRLRLLTTAGFPAHRLWMSGSAAASRTTPQILADVIDLPVTCVETGDVSALGAAMLARSLDSPGSLAEVARNWSRAGRTWEPGPQRPVYAALFEEYLAPFHGAPVKEMN
jgi:xylulokinase